MSDAEPCLHFDANADGLRLCLIGRGQPPFGCGRVADTGRVLITCTSHQPSPQSPFADHSDIWRAMWAPRGEPPA